MLGKDKLINLKLTAFFISPRSWAIFQNFDVERAKNTYDTYDIPREK